MPLPDQSCQRAMVVLVMFVCTFGYITCVPSHPRIIEAVCGGRGERLLLRHFGDGNQCSDNAAIDLRQALAGGRELHDVPAGN